MGRLLDCVGLIAFFIASWEGNIVSALYTAHLQDSEFLDYYPRACKPDPSSLFDMLWKSYSVPLQPHTQEQNP